MMDQETEKILDLIQTFIINQIHNTLCYCNSSQHAEIQNLVQNRLQHSGIKQQGVVAHTYGSFRSVWCNCWVGKDFIIMCLSDFVSFLYIIFVLLGWRTSNIYCKTGMLVRNSLHYCFSKKLFSLMSKDKCIRYRILVCWLVCRLIPFIGFGNFSCISLSPNSFFFSLLEFSTVYNKYLLSFSVSYSFWISIFLFDHFLMVCLLIQWPFLFDVQTAVSALFNFLIW